MKHPNPLLLVRIAQGDAYGMSCEYIKLPRDQHVYDRALRFEGYGKHPTHRLKKGQYTDDTQMSVAVTEVLLKDNTARLSEFEFADSFLHCFKRDQREGYSRGFQAFLEKVSTPQEFLATIKSDSDKNGAAMRSVPIGVLQEPKDVVETATVQAKITHNTPGGIDASVAVALMSHFALYVDEPLSRLPEWLAEYQAPSRLPKWPQAPVQGPGVGINTARAVLTLLVEETTLLGIVKRAIEWGGDTDSVLAIAWGIASARMHEELPPFFDGGLENGTYGRDFLLALGKQLMETYAQTR